MDLTTVAAVKTRLQSVEDAETAFDAVLGAYISHWSAAAVRILGREPDTAERTKIIRISRGQTVVRLPAYPISSVATVELSDLDGVTWSSCDYQADNDSGVLRLQRELTYGDLLVRITWTGGMAADTAAFVAAYPDIAGAVADQVVFAFQRRSHLGTASKGTGGASVQIAAQGWIDGSLEIIESHRSLIL